MSVKALFELGAFAYLTLGDSGGVVAVLRQANDIFLQRPDLGLLPQQAAELRGARRRTGAHKRGIFADHR